MDRIQERLTLLETRVAEQLRPPLWLERNYTEPRVNYAVQDLVRPNWVTYDVGANFGGIAVAMSRLVGPRGAVCGFEANPLIAAKCQKELLRSGAYNTQLYQGAIYKKSGEMIELYLSDNEVADSIYRQTERSIRVQTIALDDFVEMTRLVPHFVKMDIEGAEADALLGFERCVDSYSPIFILEHTPPDNTCLEFLFSKGYVAIDLKNYRRIRSPSDIEPGTIVTDLLYSLPDKLLGTPYGLDLSAIEEARLSGSDFSWTSENNYRSSSLNLGPGRYIATLHFTAMENANTMCGVWPDGEHAPLMRVHASSSGLVGFARDIVFDTVGGSVHFYFHFLEEKDPTLSIESVTLYRVSGFDAFHAPFRISV